ncbi:MAG: glycosyl hydrolase family 28-related protein, partial [Mucilaginibacter sp.]
MRKLTFAFAVLFVALSVTTQAQNNIFNVRAFGATGNGQTSDTKAINKAIDSAAGAGGGKVYFPAGNYLSGSIHLKSNISIYLEQGATIIATDKDPGTEYDQEEQTVNMTYQDFGHSHFHDALIWGENVHDVSIL